MERSRSLPLAVAFGAALVSLLTLLPVAPLRAQGRSLPPSARTARVSPDAARAAQESSRRPHGPPREALEACRSHASGAACTFTGPRGESLDGRCGAPEGMPLACMPSRPPGPPPGPPPEAAAACRGQSSGSACSFPAPDGRAMSGRCGTPRGAPSGAPIACMPDRPPAPPPEALAACEDIAEGDACVVETPRGTIEGECHRLHDGPSACVPHGPPPPPPPASGASGGGPV